MSADHSLDILIDYTPVKGTVRTSKAMGENCLQIKVVSFIRKPHAENKNTSVLSTVRDEVKNNAKIEKQSIRSCCSKYLLILRQVCKKQSKRIHY